MPDVEVLKFPSREGAANLQDQEDRQAVCPSRRRSCALVNTPSPCVNKAVCHIQELKRKLENWWQLHLRPDGKTLNNNMLGLTSDGQDDGLPKELCIEGIGLLGDSLNGMRTLRKEAMDILMNAAYLIERLEADRQEAKEALHKEKQTREALTKKMDSLTLWRMQEFPVVVQNEHEACLRDICELKWHLKRKKEKLEQVKDKVTHTQVLHIRLSEDINFVKNHEPLVNEKLEMETEIMSKITAAQIEADETFSKTTKSLSKCEHELKEEEDGFLWEKKEFERELGKSERNLLEREQECKELQELWVGISKRVEETEEAIAEMTDVCNHLSQRVPELEQQEDIFKDKVMALKLEIEMEGAKIYQIKTCKADLQKQISETRQAGESKVAELEDYLCKKRKEMTALQEETKELELEIEDFSKKINQSEQAMKQLQVDMVRIKLKITQNEEARAKTQDELSQVMALHCSTKAKLEDLEQLTFTEEQRNRKVTENLKKNIMVEMKAIAILKGKLSEAKMEFSEEEAKINGEMEELLAVFEEASSATAALEMEVTELSKIYKEKAEQTENLKTELANIQTAKQNYSDDLRAKHDAKLQSLNAVRELHNYVSNKYEDAKSRIVELRAISIEYREESDMMERTAKFLPAINEELQSICDGILYKHERVLAITTSLQQDITSCEERTIDTAEAHELHLGQRKAVKQKMKADLAEALSENVRLANEYRDLQKALMNAKREAVFVFDEKNRAEVSFLERKQLSLLQKRMHKAMVKYFNHRSLHSQAELAYFQSLSNANNQKITTVQEELSKAIQRLSAFLHSLTDDSTTTGDDANKQSGPDANGLSGEMPAVQIAV